MTEPIKLPPLVGPLADLPERHKEVIEAYGKACARAAIEADRRSRGELLGYVSSQAVLCNFPICLPADLFQTEDELLQKYPEAMPMPVYTAPQPKQQASESAANYDLNTSKGGREYLAKFFAKRLGRHDFQRYITTTLAADFACVLSKWLRDSAPQPQQIPKGYRLQPLSEFDAMMDTRTIPEGYKLVPIEPTDRMLGAALRHIDGMASMPSAYKAMLEAAPEVKGKP